MSWIAVGLAGAGALGGLVNNHQKQAEFNRQKQLAGDTQRWSYLTGKQGDMPTSQPNAFGSVLQGGLAGAQLGTQLGAAGAKPQASPGATDAMGAGGSAWSNLGSADSSLPYSSGMNAPTFWSNNPYLGR